MTEKWLWMMKYCKTQGIPPAQLWAWEEAEKEYHIAKNNKQSYEDYLEKFSDDLYCEFMEQGLQYELDVDYERWCEHRYNKYLRE